MSKSFKSSHIQKKTDITAHVHVLVVEDNMPATMAAKLFLQRCQCTVDIAQDGVQALEKVSNNIYDLILMDIGLPDIGGIEVTRRIRRLPDIQKSQTPIIALTSHADNTQWSQQCLDVGMQKVLTKPLQLPTLTSILQQYVFDNRTIKPTVGEVKKTSSGNSSEATTENFEKYKIIEKHSKSLWDTYFIIKNLDSDLSFQKTPDELFYSSDLLYFSKQDIREICGEFTARIFLSTIDSKHLAAGVLISICKSFVLQLSSAMLPPTGREIGQLLQENNLSRLALDDGNANSLETV